MAQVRQSGTVPEMVVRKVVHAMGFRYRLHVRALPGSPDLVFQSRRKIIFVHGCFWHRHDACRLTTTPKTRTDFWQAKFAANVARDAHVIARLQELGWEVLTIWQCEAKPGATLEERIRQFLA